MNIKGQLIKANLPLYIIVPKEINVITISDFADNQFAFILKDKKSAKWFKNHLLNYIKKEIDPDFQLIVGKSCDSTSLASGGKKLYTTIVHRKESITKIDNPYSSITIRKTWKTDNFEWCEYLSKVLNNSRRPRKIVVEIIK